MLHEAPPALAIDTTLGPYRVLAAAGQGTFGAVYEAVDTGNGERVALKVLRTRDSYALSDFKNELRRLREVSHPAIVVADAVPARPARPHLREAGRPLLDFVRCEDVLAPAVEQLLERWSLVDDLAAAAELADQHPGLSFVTVDGDVRDDRASSDSIKPFIYCLVKSV